MVAVSLGSRTLAPGTRLGRYTLLNRLARGGMAEVYLARVEGIEGFQKLVAIKLIHGHLTESPEFIEMFLNEARIAASLDHPNVCNVLDLGVVDQEHYIAMEYIHGESLRGLLRSSGGEPLPMACALSIMRGACAGLHYVHEHRGPDGQPRHLVHRDISPANIMVRFDGGIKIVDFGIAKAVDVSSATRSGTIKGKAAYMSPEQTFGEPVDRRSDVFSLGIVLYEVTTGHRMFFGDNDMAVMNRIVDGRYARPRELRPDYPEALERIILRAVSPEPGDRYPTVAAMQHELEEWTRVEQVRVSELDVGALMQERFGERPYPVVADVSSPDTPSPGPGSESHSTPEPRSTTERSPAPEAGSLTATVTTPYSRADDSPESTSSRRGVLLGVGLSLGLVGLGGALGIVLTSSGDSEHSGDLDDPADKASAAASAGQPAPEASSGPDAAAGSGENEAPGTRAATGTGASASESASTSEPADAERPRVRSGPNQKKKRKKSKAGRAKSSKRKPVERDPMRPL